MIVTPEKTNEKENASHVENIAYDAVDDRGVVDEARDVTALEHGMTLRQALKTYPNAIGWCSIREIWI